MLLCKYGFAARQKFEGYQLHRNNNVARQPHVYTSGYNGTKYTNVLMTVLFLPLYYVDVCNRILTSFEVVPRKVESTPPLPPPPPHYQPSSQNNTWKMSLK